MLVLDEATSALDNMSQKIIYDNLENLGITRFVIAHRLSTIKKADVIYVLHQGEIVEQGTYEELMGRFGHFYQLASKQI
jgi:ATP-binding cassette subfamily C protein